MVVDRLEELPKYCPPDSRLSTAFEWLVAEWHPGMPDGRVEVSGDDIYATIQSYETRPLEQCRFEAHLTYLDIQYVFVGAEAMGWAPVPALEVVEEYNPERDVMFLTQPGSLSLVNIYAGQFAMFFPGDAHEPGIRIPGFENVRKVVVKVRV